MAGRKVIFAPFWPPVQTFHRPHYLPLALRGCFRSRIGAVSCLGCLDAPAVLPNRVKSTVRTPVTPRQYGHKTVHRPQTMMSRRGVKHLPSQKFKKKNTPFIVKKKVSIVKKDFWLAFSNQTSPTYKSHFFFATCLLERRPVVHSLLNLCNSQLNSLLIVLIPKLSRPSDISSNSPCNY